MKTISFSSFLGSFLSVVVFGCVLGTVLILSTAGACPDCAGGKTAAIVVDMQGDFSTWKNGALAVSGADETFFEKVEDATEDMQDEGFLIFATTVLRPSHEPVPIPIPHALESSYPIQNALPQYRRHNDVFAPTSGHLGL